MTKLWQKDTETVDELVEMFETENDLTIDKRLIKFDVYGSLAHSYMLSKIDILTQKEFKTIKKGLLAILALNNEGKINLKFGDEDIHTKIENILVDYCGDVGKKIHAGRSRNDQILLDLRLYTKERLLSIWDKTVGLTSLMVELCEKYKDLPMPGYTHMQKAMPSSVGMWFGAYAESFLDDMELIKCAFLLNDQSPLGSAAGYGTTLPLDRKLVADLLGFKKVQNNSLYCQNSRGKIESIVVFALLQLMLDISKFASDVVIFTTSEFNFFTVDDKLCTGSSIMPQKRNVDVAELLRAKVHTIHAYLSQIFNVVVNLPSGYNRDVQDTKKPFIDGLVLTESVIKITLLLIKGLTPNKKEILDAMMPDLYATYAANELVKKGVPFREAYKKIANEIQSLPNVDPKKHLRDSMHIGGTGNLQIKAMKKKLALFNKSLHNEKEWYNKAINYLLEESD